RFAWPRYLAPASASGWACRPTSTWRKLIAHWEMRHCGSSGWRPRGKVMSQRILVFYGSYRSDRMGIRLADYCVGTLQARGIDAELIDARAVGLPMLDRMYKEYPEGQAPDAMEALAGKIRGADGFVFVTGEYNW